MWSYTVFFKRECRRMSCLGPVMRWLESIWLWDDGRFSLYKSPDESVPVTAGWLHHYREIQQIVRSCEKWQLLVMIKSPVRPRSPVRWITIYYCWLVIPVFVCGVAGLDRTIIIIRDNRLLSLQVIKSSRCKSQEKNINLWSVGKQERAGPIVGLTSFCWGRLSRTE